MSKSETNEHKKLKDLLCEKLKEWIGASIEEYPSSGHELDVYAATSDGITVYVEIIWTDSKAHFLSDINMLQQSDANVKLTIGSPAVIKKYQREFSKTVISQRNAGIAIHGEMLNGARILLYTNYLEKDVRKAIIELVKQARQLAGKESPSTRDLTHKMLALASVRTALNIVREGLMKSLSAFALEGNGIVVGVPGVGKTFALRSLASELVEQRIPCLYLPIDRLAVEAEGALKTELGIVDNFIAYLRQQSSNNGTPGVLVIDGFDAARSETVQRFFLSLISRVINELQGRWNIIVGVRAYDAEKSEDLLDLFPDTPRDILGDFQMTDIHCRHFAIPKLTYDEVKITAKTIPHLSAIYERGSQEFKELLSIPFNLWLLEKLLRRAPNIPDLSSVSSEVQLLGLFWRQRVTDGHLGEDRRVLLTRITQAMVTERSLSVRVDQVYDFHGGTAWKSLMSSEILVNASTMGQRVAFTHNILFDYAVSVLLIEDRPEKLIEFVAKDPSRPLFLRPSLNYYFIRLWHTAPNLFWDAFWHILPSRELHLRLFARLLPASVIVNEARALRELTPLLDSLTRERPTANEALLCILQAIRALEIQRDELWIQFLEQSAKHLQREFAWDLAIVTSDIIERSEENGNSAVFQSCGRISRRLLEWIWMERKRNQSVWIDRLGASWAVPLVAKTFATDPKASRFLLENVLGLLKEERFPIQFLFHLTDQVDKIWPYDSDFVVLIYIAVFSHSEYSEEKTSFGTPVMPLSSTRRQDYEGCHYELIRHFPRFLQSNPLTATRAVIQSLNAFIVGKHVNRILKESTEIEDFDRTFSFRGQFAHYIPDDSYIWDDRNYNDEPVKMAGELFKFMTELASSEEFGQIESLLDVFRDNVQVAYFWRKVLATGAKFPRDFAPLLFELCIAPPVQTGRETLYELGLFLEVAAPEFRDAQLRQIEESIVSVSAAETDVKNREYIEHCRDRLLARIPRELLRTNEARKIREKMERADSIPANKPLGSIRIWSEPYSEEKSLQEQGVDLSRTENQRLHRLFLPIEKFISEWENKIPTADAVKMILPAAKELHTLIKDGIGADPALLDLAWTKLASCADKMGKGITGQESEEYLFCREVLLSCARHRLPEPDPEHDAKYSAPCWSPAPRNYAAQSLPWLAMRNPDPDILNEIRTLVNDQVPSVRFLVTMELFRIYAKKSEEFWSLVDQIAELIERTHR